MQCAIAWVHHPTAAPTTEKNVLTCDCGAYADQDPGENPTHKPSCIHWTLEPINPADEYDLYFRYGL